MNKIDPILLVKLWNEGVRERDIARRFDCWPESVQSWVRKLNLPRRAKGGNHGDDGKLPIEYHKRRFEIPDEEHEEEVARHPVAWFVMTRRTKR